MAQKLDTREVIAVAERYDSNLSSMTPEKRRLHLAAMARSLQKELTRPLSQHGIIHHDALEVLLRAVVADIEDPEQIEYIKSKATIGYRMLMPDSALA